MITSLAFTDGQNSAVQHVLGVLVLSFEFEHSRGLTPSPRLERSGFCHLVALARSESITPSGQGRMAGCGGRSRGLNIGFPRRRRQGPFIPRNDRGQSNVIGQHSHRDGICCSPEMSDQSPSPGSRRKAGQHVLRQDE